MKKKWRIYPNRETEGWFFDDGDVETRTPIRDIIIHGEVVFRYLIVDNLRDPQWWAETVAELKYQGAVAVFWGSVVMDQKRHA